MGGQLMENRTMENDKVDSITDRRKEWKAPAIRELEINKDTYAGSGSAETDLVYPATS
jgi:hypothetical protein